MKQLLALLCLIPTAAMAASAFDGTWKTKTGSIQYVGKPSEFEISQGMYTCSSCVPAIHIKADGTDQKVTGHDYYDSVAVKVVNATTIEMTNKKGGKTMSSAVVTVSADGKVLTQNFKDYSGAQVATGSYTSKRVANGPPGSHALSGKWQQDAISDGSDSLMTVKYQSTADGLKMSWNGQSYDAKFDGKEVLTKDDPGRTMVSLKRVNEKTFEETDHRAGKVTDVFTNTVAADGKTMTVVDEDPVRGSKTTFVMEKQP